MRMVDGSGHAAAIAVCDLLSKPMGSVARLPEQVHPLATGCPAIKTAVKFSFVCRKSEFISSGWVL